MKVTAISRFEDGIEDALDQINPTPDPMFYDDYMSGYTEGQRIRNTPPWLERYNQGVIDGKAGKDPVIGNSLAYMRGFGDGVLELVAALEALEEFDPLEKEE